MLKVRPIYNDVANLEDESVAKVAKIGKAIFRQLALVDADAVAKYLAKLKKKIDAGG